MKRTLTKTEMLALWRRMRMAEPLRLDCTLTRTDGADFDGQLVEEMRAWYLNLLDEGEERYIVGEEIAPAVTAEVGGGLTRITAPENVRRILRVGFEDWASSLMPDRDIEEISRAAANPYCRRPAAARVSAREVIVCGAQGALSSVIAVCDPGPEIYVFDDSCPLAGEESNLTL